MAGFGNLSPEELAAIEEGRRLEEERLAREEQEQLAAALAASGANAEAYFGRRFEEETSATKASSKEAAEEQFKGNILLALHERIPADRRDAAVLLAELDAVLANHLEGSTSLAGKKWTKEIRDKVMGWQRILKHYLERTDQPEVREVEAISLIPQLLLEEIYDAGYAGEDEKETDKVYAAAVAKRDELNAENTARAEAAAAERAVVLEKIRAKEEQRRVVNAAKEALNTAKATLEANKGRAARYGIEVKDKEKKEKAIVNAQKAYNNAKAALNAMEGGRRRTRRKMKKSRKAKKGSRRH
jgi:hypothetical protein